MSRLRMPIGSVWAASFSSVDEADAASVLAGPPASALRASSFCDRVTCGTHLPAKFARECHCNAFQQFRLRTWLLRNQPQRLCNFFKERSGIASWHELLA